MPHVLELPKLVWKIYQEARSRDASITGTATLKILHAKHFLLQNTDVAKEIISVPRMKRIVQQFESEAATRARKRRRANIDSHEAFICAAIAKDPSMCLDELQTALRAETGRTFSTSVLCRALCVALSNGMICRECS